MLQRLRCQISLDYYTIPPATQAIQILTLFQTKKCHFSHPFSDLEVVTKLNITCLHKTKIMSSLLRVKPQQRDLLKSISNLHITLSFWFIWNWNDKHIDKQPSFLCKPYSIPDQNGQNLYPFSDQNGAKTLPFGAAHTFMAYTCIRKYPPPPHHPIWGPPPPGPLFFPKILVIFKELFLTVLPYL